MDRARLWGVAFLLITAIGWALNWPTIKFLLQVWPAFFARGVAGVGAALLLGLLALSRGESLHVPRSIWPQLGLTAFTSVFAWMGFATVSLNLISVAEAALLVYSMPIWAMLLAWPLRGERPGLRALVALALAIAGVVLLLSGQHSLAGRDQMLGVGLALAAAVLFAWGTVANPKPLPLAPLAQTAWVVGVGCAPMIVLGLVFEHPQLDALTGVAAASLAYMTLVPMGLCYLTWFGALRRLPTGIATITMLLVPLLGTLSAAAILGDPFGLREGGALALTLTGVALALKGLSAPAKSRTPGAHPTEPE
ncbi:DMT family transporter [Xanthobacter tagetidis]|uniref:DMT family transporter n=1 Tax=Xanthobacter tagetidis TaxID=60216 RepID=A0A3L7A2D1_9HYPH|nr:DMT family transporter [Xanthobacter tagetidis]MBB6309208.1 drug/metabolite transporter (DMT)-like permease [Xanthobacter tagetidis]RLP74170.1 DMT family transporter [Xanthobacter tagetidis]